MGPASTVREVMEKQRVERDAHVEIALQDFLELTPAEQMEFLAVGLLQSSQQVQWCVTAIQRMNKN